MKSLFDFIGRTETEKYSRLPRNAETGDSDKEALFASAGGVEVSEFLGGGTRQTTRGARRWSWTILKVNFILSNSKLKTKASINYRSVRNDLPLQRKNT
ncbi:hypothetical protein [Bacillus sp. ISL-45]|uniref:hypothetical protein n=1 Tax=Bacillus sp. ISL-45 TaxID=2819128 RepID=UPI001BE7CB13|nr:hypothetical protein [Bacillus sp. ISL-45]MBT2638383.1 hypothetical protein [Bacillus sp. ISL-39]MBT2662250.1 hypothetical protein [Bacillus sp. ISL-45]